MVAVAAVLVAAAPGTAFAGHDLGVYKVEKHVDLDSDELTVELACQPGDYAMDGMWRVDHVDQDDDDLFVTAIGRAVDVQAAYPFVGTTGNPGSHRDSYRFTFYKNAIGRVQLKVFLTCLEDRTEVDGHQHGIVVDKEGPIVDGNGIYVTSPACAAGEFVAGPGFEVLNANPAEPDPFIGHVWASFPLTATSWSWGLDLSQDQSVTQDSAVRFTWSCVHRRLQPAGGSSHKLVYRLQSTPTTGGLPAGKVVTRRIECGAHYKAAVAGFHFPGSPSSGLGWDPNPEFASSLLPKVWWLGMDPQPRNRDLRFLNSDAAVFYNTTLSAICLNYRTT